MKTAKQKLYCYVDETGQDTAGMFFLVAIIITNITKKDKLEKILEKIEERTGKKKKKWTKMEFEERKKYMRAIVNLKELNSSIYYSLYRETKTYTQLTALTVAKAIFTKTKDINYSVVVIVDGLTKKDTEKIRKELKKLNVKYNNIRGMKDEQSAFLRLADYIAGLLRDNIEKQSYATKLLSLLEKKKIIFEV